MSYAWFLVVMVIRQRYRHHPQWEEGLSLIDLNPSFIPKSRGTTHAVGDAFDVTARLCWTVQSAAASCHAQKEFIVSGRSRAALPFCPCSSSLRCWRRSGIFRYRNSSGKEVAYPAEARNRHSRHCAAVDNPGSRRLPAG